MVLSQCMQNEKDKKMTEYLKSKIFLEKNFMFNDRIKWKGTIAHANLRRPDGTLLQCMFDFP